VDAGRIRECPYLQYKRQCPELSVAIKAFLIITDLGEAAISAAAYGAVFAGLQADTPGNRCFP